MSRPMNFNPFRGYSQAERNIKNRAVREQIKDIAQLEGAIVIRRDGVAVAACVRVEAPSKGVPLSMGLGTRHASAAAISKHTKAVAVCVSQSSGSVRLFQNGEVVLHIEPLDRPLTFGPLQMDADANGPTPRERKGSRVEGASYAHGETSSARPQPPAGRRGEVRGGTPAPLSPGGE
jgi:hypothetical protein